MSNKKLSKIVTVQDDTADIVLPLLSIIIVLFFIAIILWLIFKNPAPDIVKKNGKVYLSCEPGQCVTNIFTGVKTCSDNNTQTLLYDPEYQTCNSQYTCESQVTPFAVQIDGSTNISGVCPEGVVCRCLREPQCATEITVPFQSQNGNPYQSIVGQTTTFSQVYGYVDKNGDVLPNQPVKIPRDQSSNVFCSISNDWLPRIWPKECAIGTLAYYPNNPSNFNLAKANITPLACVIGESCSLPTETAVWDSRIGQVFCYELCTQPSTCIDGTQSTCLAPIWSPSEGQLTCQAIGT